MNTEIKSLWWVLWQMLTWAPLGRCEMLTPPRPLGLRKGWAGNRGLTMMGSRGGLSAPLARGSQDSINLINCPT